MDSAILSLLGAFLLSIMGLFVFIWSMRKGPAGREPPGGLGHLRAWRDRPGRRPPRCTRPGRAHLQAAAAEPGDALHAADPRELAQRIEADRSSAFPVFMFIAFAILWLVLGSVAGLTASLKLHMPDWLVGEAWQTFGRVRTMHLTAVLYGWITNAALGLIVWLLPRLLRTRLFGAPWVMLGGAFINIAIASAIGAIGAGWSDGMEYLEMPWQIGLFIVVGFVCIIGPVLYTLVNRQVESLYVSVWYLVAALLWITLLFLVAKLPGVHTGVQQATTNWWYGHNVLGLWFTPISVGAIYYFLPKIIGRPVRSYNLSILGFWTLAFFYGQVGGHHLIGGPIPGWLSTLSIVQSMMMIIPVAAFTINMAGTMQGRMHLALHSPTLRFMMFGGLMYMLSSVQGLAGGAAQRQPGGALHAFHGGTCAPGGLCLRHHGAVRRHLLHAAARAALGVAVPAPHLAAVLARGHRHWHLLRGPLHRRLAAGPGHARCLAALHGVGRAHHPLPAVAQRGVGALMVLSHLVFAGHFLAMALRFGPQRTGAALFAPQSSQALEIAHGK
jgi:cytochrome c oxidase cbb3-type subunit 1